jgi:hypothetical protein
MAPIIGAGGLPASELSEARKSRAACQARPAK